MKGRALPVFLATLMLAVVVAGCAPAAPVPAAPKAPAAAPAPAAPAKPATPAAPATPAPKEQTIIRLMAGTAGGSTWNWFSALAVLAQKYSPWLKCDVLPTKGMAEALRFVLEGKGELAVTAGYLVDRAKTGTAEYKDMGPRADSGLVFNLALLYMHAVVLDKSPIKSLTADDLKGKTIATLEPGSASVELATAYFKALGLDTKKDVRMLYMKSSDAVSAVLDGTADVYMHGTGFPQTTIAELFATKPARLLPVPPELTKKANEISGAGLAPSTMPANIYPGQKQPVLSSSTPMVAVSREAVKDEVIYELVRLWWQYMDERNEISAEIARQATVENLKTSIESARFPLHKGALKYYREKGWAK